MRIRIIISLLVLYAMASCSERYYFTDTVFSPDGSSVRTVRTNDTSGQWMEKNPGLWKLSSVMDSLRAPDGTVCQIRCLAEAESEDVSGYGSPMRESFDKDFRWFRTYYTYTAAYPQPEGIPVPLDRYLDEDERNLWLRGTPHPDLISGMETLSILDDISTGFYEWMFWSKVELSLDILYGYVPRDLIPGIEEDKEKIFSGFNHKESYPDPAEVADALDRYYSTTAYTSIYKSASEPIDAAFESVDDRITSEFMGRIVNSVSMPGTVIDWSDGYVDGNKVTWYVLSLKAMDGDYVMTAVSVRNNIWAYAVVIVLLAGLIFSVVRVISRRI